MPLSDRICDLRRRLEALRHPAATPAEWTKLPLDDRVKNLEELRSAVNDAAGVAAGLWLSYIFVLLYLLIAATTVTHRELLLESPVKLPFLNVDLPLKNFFWFGPALFLIVHAYVLIHFVMFSTKIAVFDVQLRAQVDDLELRSRLRRQLSNNVFAQLLCGPREIRSGITGFLMRLIVWISLVFAAVTLFVVFELQFLPYHYAPITWWQRIAVVLDLILLWSLWPRIISKGAIGSPTRTRLLTTIMMAGVTFVTVPLMFAVATFPGEALEEALPSVWLIRNKTRSSNQTWPGISLRELLVDGEVSIRDRRLTSLWSNRLVLPGFDVIDHTKLDTEQKIGATLETLSLRARHLEGAVLPDANLRKVDFSASRLAGATLTNADLRDAKFDCPATVVGKLDPGNDCTQLQGADLGGAQLQGTILTKVQLQGADLHDAQLQGARISGSSLTGANLRGAQLQGAEIENVDLQGVELDGAILQAAWIYNVCVWHTDIRKVDIKGAFITLPVTDLPLVYPPPGCDWSVASLQQLEHLIGRSVLEELRRDKILGKIHDRLSPTIMFSDEKAIAGAWVTASSVDKHRAEEWLAPGCLINGAPYIIEALTRRLSGSDCSWLATKFLDEEHCPGALGLSAKARATLKQVRDRISMTSQPSLDGACLLATRPLR